MGSAFFPGEWMDAMFSIVSNCLRRRRLHAPWCPCLDQKLVQPPCYDGGTGCCHHVLESLSLQNHKPSKCLLFINLPAGDTNYNNIRKQTSIHLPKSQPLICFNCNVSLTAITNGQYQWLQLEKTIPYMTLQVQKTILLYCEYN